MDKVKTIKSKTDFYIEFSEEERTELGWSENQKLDFKLQGDGVFIQPWKKIEIDLETFPREVLETIINESCERDVSANTVIVDMIKKGLDLIDPQEINLSEIDPNFTNNDIGLPGGSSI